VKTWSKKAVSRLMPFRLFSTMFSLWQHFSNYAKCRFGFFSTMFSLWQHFSNYAKTKFG